MKLNQFPLKQDEPFVMLEKLTVFRNNIDQFYVVQNEIVSLSVTFYL